MAAREQEEEEEEEEAAKARKARDARRKKKRAENKQNTDRQAALKKEQVEATGKAPQINWACETPLT